jgi:hypothetical protein
MSDQLAYIREAVEKGERAMVIRTKVDPVSGLQIIDAKIQVNATTALQQLSLPNNKRQTIWKRIYPIGYEAKLTGGTSKPEKSDTNPLSDDDLIAKMLANPDLLKQLKAAEKASKKAEKESGEPEKRDEETEQLDPLV